MQDVSSIAYLVFSENPDKTLRIYLQITHARTY